MLAAMLFLIGPRLLSKKAWHGLEPSSHVHTSSHKMASKFEEGRHWAQVIFTHDSKPPVLIDKEQITLGRKEGTRKGTKGNRMSKMIISPFNIMYTREIDQLVRFFILYIIWLTCSFRQITFQGWLRDKWNTYLYLIREKWRWNPKDFFLICFGLVLLNVSLFNTQQYSALAFQSWWTKWPIKNFS